MENITNNNIKFGHIWLHFKWFFWHINCAYCLHMNIFTKDPALKQDVDFNEFIAAFIWIHELIFTVPKLQFRAMGFLQILCKWQPCWPVVEVIILCFPEIDLLEILNKDPDPDQDFMLGNWVIRSRSRPQHHDLNFLNHRTFHF